MTKELIRCAFDKGDKTHLPHFNLEYKDGTPATIELDEWKYPLPNGTYYYAITKYSIDPVLKIIQDRAVGAALTALNLYPKNIRLRRWNPKKQSRDLLHMPLQWLLDDEYLNDPGRKTVIAYTWMYNGTNLKRPIVFDENEDWRTHGGSFTDPDRNPQWPNTKYRANPIAYVTGHEGGHWMSLVHTPRGTGSMMDPIVPVEAPKRFLGAITENRIESMYGKRNLPTWIINRFWELLLTRRFF